MLIRDMNLSGQVLGGFKKTEYIIFIVSVSNAHIYKCLKKN